MGDKWWQAGMVWLIVRICAFAFTMLFAAGFLLTVAKRFDESHIDELIVDGGRIDRQGDQIRLRVLCKGQDAGYEYDVNLSQLKLYSSTQARLVSQSGQSISSIFPVTKEELVLAAGLLGGSVGMASMLEKARLAITESRMRSKSIGFTAPEPRKPGFFDMVLVEPLVILGSAVTALLAGYYSGKYVAEWLGLDVDCSSKLLDRKLANQATWRSLIGTVFAHGYANLLDCVKSGQLRTAMAGAAIDYLDASSSLEIGRQLSRVDDTLRKRLDADPNRQCGPSRKGIRFVENGEETGLVFSDRNRRFPGCWTDEDVDEALRARQMSRKGPLAQNTSLTQHMVAREFTEPSVANRRAQPTPADALVKAMERLGKGRLINERGETSIGVDDLLLLLDTKAQLQESKGCRIR